MYVEENKWDPFQCSKRIFLAIVTNTNKNNAKCFGLYILKGDALRKYQSSFF